MLVTDEIYVVVVYVCLASYGSDNSKVKLSSCAIKPCNALDLYLHFDTRSR
jgi:hypothetical protein